MIPTSSDCKNFFIPANLPKIVEENNLMPFYVAMICPGAGVVPSAMLAVYSGAMMIVKAASYLFERCFLGDRDSGKMIEIRVHKDQW